MRKSVSIALLLLAACGEGSGSTPTPAGPTPSPTATATPAPTPTATATPSQAFDFAGSLFGQSPYVEAVGIEVYDAAAPTSYRLSASQASIDPSPAAAILNWDFATSAATARIAGVLETYDAASLTSRQADGIRFVRQPDVDTQLTFAWARAANFYSSSTAKQEDRRKGTRGEIISTTRYFLPGIATPAAEIPASGTLRFASLVVGMTVGKAAALSGNLDVTLDLSGNRLSGSLTAGGRTVVLTGTVDRAQAMVITGTATVDGISGRLVGNLFGAQGRELGLLFEVSDPAGSSAGQVIGLKQ